MDNTDNRNIEDTFVQVNKVGKLDTYSFLFNLM